MVGLFACYYVLCLHSEDKDSFNGLSVGLPKRNPPINTYYQSDYCKFFIESKLFNVYVWIL